MQYIWLLILKRTLLFFIKQNEQAGLNDTVIMSFAGKAEGNALLPIGTYGKLAAVFTDYRKNLELFLQECTGREMHILLINNETAAALSLSDFEGLAITLGTAFGLGAAEYRPGLNTYDQLKII